MDSEIAKHTVNRGDWTLFVRSKVPADCIKWAQCDLLDQVDWEEMGIYHSKQFDIDFPYYRNKEKKLIVVKGNLNYHSVNIFGVLTFEGNRAFRGINFRGSR